ncbi:MAG: flagellar biosynthetic protein FliR [Planctomyces sp.]|nr:flagellar biosynthetic protein FliR [Planctomyces sp.]
MTDVWTMALILARTASFIALFPPWAGRNLPQLVKVGLAVALTVFWMGSVPLTANLPSNWFSICVTAAREVLVGGVLAQVLGLSLVPARIAGTYIAQEMGLTFAALTSPIDNQASDPVSQIFEATTLALFFVLDGHHFVFRVLDASWTTAPCGGGWPTLIWARCATAATGSVEVGLAIAASIGVVLAIVSFWLALTTRVAPQMHVFAWGASIRIVVGLIALLVFLPELLLACGRALMSRQAMFLLN